MKKEESPMLNAINMWLDAEKTKKTAKRKIIKEITAFAKENEGKIIYFDGRNTDGVGTSYNKLRYTKRRGVELGTTPCSVCENHWDSFKEVIDDSENDYLGFDFIGLAQTICSYGDIYDASKDGKRIKKINNLSKQEEFVDFDGEEYMVSEEDINRLKEFFELNIEKFKYTKDGKIDYYEFKFPENKKIPITYFYRNTLREDFANGLLVTIYNWGTRDVVFTLNDSHLNFHVLFRDVHKTNAKSILDYLINLANQKKS